MGFRHSVWIAAVLVVCACRGPDGPSPPPGELRSALAGPTLGGGVFDPGALPGRVTLVTFWSPSCGYCVQELPHLQAIADEADGVDLVTVLITNELDRAQLVARQRGLRAPVVLDNGRLRRAFRINQTPTTVLLDDDGHAYQVIVGAVPKDRIARAARAKL